MRPAVLLLLAACATPPADLALTDRMIWTGERFERGDLFVRDGVITRDASVGEGTIVLGGEGRFVVPGYTDAHQHVTSSNEETSRAFLELGTYYAWNPNSLIRFATDEATAFQARTDTLDVKDAFGGLTEPGSHPEPLYTQTLARYVYTDIPPDAFEGDAFFHVRSPDEAGAALDRLAAAGADLVKLYLLGSEGYAADGSADTGLDPSLVPDIVAGAKARGLIPVAHIETAHDLRVAAEAGVRVAMHLPDYDGSDAEDAARYAITPDLARLVAERGMAVVPTYWLAEANSDALGAEGLAAADALHRANLRALGDAGVTILSGTDGNPPALMVELGRWVETGGLTQEEALAAFLNTGRYLFAEERLGCLDPGCRADFLVLRGDPREDLDALTRIDARVKGGDVLRPSEAE